MYGMAVSITAGDGWDRLLDWWSGEGDTQHDALTCSVSWSGCEDSLSRRSCQRMASAQISACIRCKGATSGRKGAMSCQPAVVFDCVRAVVGDR